jgi:hypothetical protein
MLRPWELLRTFLGQASSMEAEPNGVYGRAYLREFNSSPRDPRALHSVGLMVQIGPRRAKSSSRLQPHLGTESVAGYRLYFLVNEHIVHAVSFECEPSD